MIVDLILTIDGLKLGENELYESIEEYINKIEEISNTSYPIIVDVSYIGE